jgi:predicted ATPase
MARRATGSAAVSQRLTQLHAAYGNALIATRGHGAPETMEAFARARKWASRDEDAPGRLAADYGLWVGSYVRGDLPSMRTHGAAFLAGVAASPDSPEAGVAHRVLGTTHCFAGEYAEAREHLERALSLFQPGRDDDLAFRFGQDAGVAAMCYLAIASWPLGNVRRAVSLVEGAYERLASVAHIGTHPYAKLHAAMFELMRGDRARAAENGSETARLAREHDLPLWKAYGAFFEGLATAEGGALGEGLSDMRRCAETLRQQDLLNFDGLFKIALAEAEARAGDRDRAIAILDEALATTDRLGYRAFEAELHRARGEMLLERDPANPAPAEEAFLTAIAIAQQQGTHSFELRAALSLAKLYQSTARPADAHAVLAPALEGFAPTDEMPEIAEAQALIAAAAEIDELKNTAAARQRRLQLQTAYGRALMWSKGISSEEARAAFARAQELAAGTSNVDERFDTYYGVWITSLRRAELRLAQEIAETFRHEAETLGRLTEVAVADRLLGRTSYCRGDFASAKAHLEAALKTYEPERDRETKFRFGVDTYFCATLYMSAVTQMLGDIEGARQLIEQSVARAVDSDHVPELMNAYLFKAEHELRLDRAESVLSAAEILDRIHRNRQTENWGVMHAAWARARLSDRKIGIAELRSALVDCVQEKNNLAVPFFQGRLSELEAEEGDFEEALTRIDEALAFARETGIHMSDAFLHRIRGEILLKRDSINPAPVEVAFQTALAIAQQQGGRFYGLQAALCLAKLYQSTNRHAEAHAVLAPALDGFTPTPEMPEIAEALALLAALGAGAHL